MNLSHTIDAVRTYDRQMRHANLLGGALFDEAHALNTAFICWKQPANIAQETSIDFVDNLELPWQQIFEPCHRPLLEGLGQQCVIGVRQGVLCDIPGARPTQVVPGQPRFASAPARPEPGAYRSSGTRLFRETSANPSCHVGNDVPHRPASRRQGSTPVKDVALAL